MGEFTRRFQSTTSVFMGGGWWGVRRNLVKLTLYSLYGWSLALVPGVIYAVARLWRREWPRRWEKLIFILLWVAPAWTYYAIVHMGQQGLVFVFLPALLLISAVALTRLLFTQTHELIVATVILVIINVGIFCLSPEYPIGGDRLRLLTRATLVNSDHYYQDRFEVIKSNFAPESTAIVAANWHHVEYYLPEYARLPFGVGSKWENDEGSPIGNPYDTVATPAELGLQLDSKGQAAIVVFDPHLMAFNDSPSSVYRLPLEHGGTLEYFLLAGERAFHWGARSFGVVEK